MWDIYIPLVQENLYDLCMWFLLYSFFGWLVESIYMTYCNKKVTNRGMVKGPFCPIYGFGGIICHMILLPYADNLVEVFFIGSFFASLIEYATGVFMIKFLGELWWDYNDKPFNYKGILCLESSVAWGLYAIADISFVKRIIFIIIGFIPVNIGKEAIILCGLYYVCALAFVIKDCFATDAETDNETDEEEPEMDAGNEMV